MIRRQFMKFAPKEHDEKKVKKTLEKNNVPTYEGNAPAKFGQFGSIAKDLAAKHRKQYATPEGGSVAEAEKTFGYQQKALYGGGNGTGTAQNADARNPYAMAQPQGNPYATPSSGTAAASSGSGSVKYGTGNPYARAAPAAGSAREGTDDFAASSPYAYDSAGRGASNPYGSNAGSNPYGSNAGSNSYGSNAGSNSYGSNAGSNPYGSNAGSNSYGSNAGSNPYGSNAGSNSYGSNTGSKAPSPYASDPYGSEAESKASIPHEAPDDLDELNQTHTELEQDSDDELMHSGASIYNAPTHKAPSVRSMHPGALPSKANALAQINEQHEDVDELNQLPSEFASEPQHAPQLFEDSEDEDVENVKTEIRQVKQESLASTRRALQIAHEAETSGRNTLGMLGDQGERLGNSAKTVSIGRVQARVAEANADELQRLNRSIFIPNVSNPFNSRRRQQMKEQRLKSERAYDEMEQQSLERMQRESERRVTDGLNGAGDGYSETAMRIQQRMNRDNPERKMYQFEADSEDEDMEDELAQNLEGISLASKRLHGLSLKINDEVTAQNQRVEEMGGRVEDLDFHLHKSTAKMSTLH